MHRRIMAEDSGGLLISEELRSELVDLYFKWQNPWLLVIDEEIYRKSLKTKGRYWSPLLENCILGLGSRFTDSPEVRADPDDTNSAGQFFFERAEVYLSYELKYPSITTVQSLYLLSMLSVVSLLQSPPVLKHIALNRYLVRRGRLHLLVTRGHGSAARS